jgi:hypothetical protein
MKKEYATALRAVFSDRLAQMCPDFNFVNKHSALTCFPGERAYCWRISEVVFLWVVLIPDQKQEAFFIEIGWSRKARFPQLTMRPSWTRPRDAGLEEEYLCRLGAVSHDNDLGWFIEEPRVDATQQEMMDYILTQARPLSAEVARSRVLPRVEQALLELVQHGLPFLLKHTKVFERGKG